MESSWRVIVILFGLYDGPNKIGSPQKTTIVIIIPLTYISQNKFGIMDKPLYFYILKQK